MQIRVLANQCLKSCPVLTSSLTLAAATDDTCRDTAPDTAPDCRPRGRIYYRIYESSETVVNKLANDTYELIPEQKD